MIHNLMIRLFCIGKFHRSVQNVTLSPYTPYQEDTIFVAVCTSAGCTEGPSVTVRTDEGTPGGIDTSPVVVVAYGGREVCSCTQHMHPLCQSVGHTVMWVR